MSEHKSSVTKRKRVENEAETAVFHSTTIWFDDGNLILQAEKQQFRVHRSLLSNYSKVFQDMFMVPQPAGDSYKEGCPIVSMPDKSEDWENVLSIMYHGMKVHQFADDIPVGVLISMIRLGKKYQFDLFCDVATRALKNFLPDTLEDWEKSHNSDPQKIIKLDYFTKGYEIDLVNFALEVELQSILPALYYVCIRDLPLISIFTGTMRINDPNSEYSRLSSETQRTLILGRDSLLKAMVKHRFHWSVRQYHLAGCTFVEKCRDNRMSYLKTLVPDLHTDVSYALQDMGGDTLSGFCRACTSFYEREISNGRRQIWSELPSYFALPAWENLTDFAS